MTAPQRPNPDELLARSRRAEAKLRRGRLKLFFGMAPGVGKTYAMLETAQRLARSGVDVVIGAVETHGRAETEQQLLGLDLLPPRAVSYRGIQLTEFDLDAAIARRPELIVVDELAHENAPGSRHQKRWQDVESLRDAGIDVFTTLNVQHIESLNDVVARITGVQVRETVPDAVLEGVDEIELVDLPPEALLERLKAGKVYVPESARNAIESFFRRSNLTALRELSLRRTAELVDRQMREEQREAGVRGVWPARERIVVCIGPSPRSATLLRAARRMAAGLHAELLAVHVDDARRGELSPRERQLVLEHLRLAESLGAEAVSLSVASSGSDPVGEILAFARSRNANRIVVGRTGEPQWREALRGSFMGNLIRRASEFDVTVLSADDEAPSTADANRDERAIAAGRFGRPMDHAFGLAMVGVAAAIASALRTPPDLSDEAMLFVGAIAIVAWRVGRWPSIVAAIVSVAAFDFFFIEPRFTFSVSDPSYAITFGVMLLVGVLVGTLTARLREQADAARERELRTAALYASARSLATARDLDEVGAVAAREARELLGADAVVLAPRAGDESQGLETIGSAGSPDWFDERERAVARRAFDHGDAVGAGTTILPASVGRSTPLSTAGGRRGVLSVRFAHTPSPTQLFLLDTLAAMVASAIERVELIDARQSARLEAETERLRSTLLSSVSHDLRTPLASIEGSASTLLDSGDALDEAHRRELLEGLVAESHRLGRLVSNLLFATRLDAGGVEAHREWTTVEEIVGAGLAPHRAALSSRDFRANVASGLPLVRVDTAMMPQVIANLVENALRYAPSGTPIRLQAWADESNVLVRVSDEGVGLGPGEAERVFRRFWRGRAAKVADAGTATRPHATHDAAVGSGMGLGLSICEGIVRIHGGRIWAEPNRPRGVAFLFSIPIEDAQPSLPAPESDGGAEGGGT
ncbi:MAG: sensor histidine kinase KdpD [Phycisphaerales bacterium]